MIAADAKLEQTATSYVSWSAVFAGAALACAVSVVLMQFGSAIGLSAASPFVPAENQIRGGVVVTAGLWILWVQVLASLLGGYIAGRMRAPLVGATEHEKEVRDGAHGLLVWAVGTLAVTVAVSVASTLAAIGAGPEDAADQTADIIRMHKNATVIFAFTTAASSLVAAVASWWAATMGGDHRDTSPDHRRHFSFKKM